ncbi:cupin domain-containing protein [Caproiciproducens sp.]
MYVVKKSAAKVSLDGPEVCRDYCRTEKLWFGSSALLPGQTGGIDPGHTESKEVFFVSRGAVIMRNPATNECFELQEGDILMVEEGEPHELTNIGMEPAVITWCGAPNP